MASRISASARPMSPAAWRVLQRREVELAAEVVEEEKAVVRIGFENARRVQAGLCDQAGDRGRTAARPPAAAARP
jgi:hypothetical protein